MFFFFCKYEFASFECTLSFLGQPGHPPDDGTVLMLVLGLPRGDLDQRLLQRVHGAQEPLDAFDFARASGIWRSF